MNTDLKSKESLTELFIKFISGHATPGEIAMLHTWILEADENRQYFLRFRNTWQAASQTAPSGSFDTEKALAKINQKLNIPLNNTEPDAGKGSITLKINRFPAVIRIAALWILLCSLGAVASWLFLKPSGYMGKSASVSVSAPMGSKALTTLPDGSKVWLNAGSTIEYNMLPDSRKREISLSGEAFFDVAKDPDRPFSVHAGELVIRAYGTEFNVKAYPDEGVVEATLIEGSVSVEVKKNSDDRIMLKPNEQVLYYKETDGRKESMIVSKGIDPALSTLWINDRLQISGETLGSLSVMLERKYDVKIYFEDQSLKDLRFTGMIQNETIEQVLELIKISSSVNYRIKGREVWLMKTMN